MNKRGLKALGIFWAAVTLVVGLVMGLYLVCETVGLPFYLLGIFIIASVLIYIEHKD